MKMRRLIAGCLLVAMCGLGVLAAGCSSGTKASTTTSAATTSTSRPPTGTTSASTSSTIAAPTSSGGVALDVPASGSGGFNYTQGSYLEGFEFTAHSPISITKLGAYDSNLSRLSGGSETFATVPVAVYDMTSNTRLGGVDVSASDAPTGVYRYVTLSTPITLNQTDTYAVVWVSNSDYYIASPTLVASDVNPGITYLAFASYGPGGLTTTSSMVEPNWFFTESANGLHALNYDLGPNFIFTTSH